MSDDETDEVLEHLAKTIDLDKERARREAADPLALRQGQIVRRGYLGEKFCAHRETEVDALARIVRCRACGVDLDAMDVLSVVASEWDRLAHAIKERKAIEDEIAKLRGEERRTKSRLRTARMRHPVIAAEVVALRRCAEHLRGDAKWSAKARALVAAVDAAREEAAE